MNILRIERKKCCCTCSLRTGTLFIAIYQFTRWFHSRVKLRWPKPEINTTTEQYIYNSRHTVAHSSFRTQSFITAVLEFFSLWVWIYQILLVLDVVYPHSIYKFVDLGSNRGITASELPLSFVAIGVINGIVTIVCSLFILTSVIMKSEMLLLISSLFEFILICCILVSCILLFFTKLWAPSLLGIFHIFLFFYFFRVLASYREEDCSYRSLLIPRGPDVIRTKLVHIDEDLKALFRGCVLWLQGSSPQQQPFVDENGNAFLWNGDNLSLQRDLQANDGHSIFQEICHMPENQFLSFLAAIEGPWSFILYSPSRQKIYFGRDPFGRHSLLWTPPQKLGGPFILSSVAERKENLQEIPAFGIFSADVKSLVGDLNKDITLFPYQGITEEQLSVDALKGVQIANTFLRHNITENLCKDIPSVQTVEELMRFPNSLEGDHLLFLSQVLKQEIDLFSHSFKRAIEKRVTACPPRCKQCTESNTLCSHSKFAVLFSGGLDSAVIAFFLSQCLPCGQSIDLLNVSFERKGTSRLPSKKGKEVPTENDLKWSSPDRESGLVSWKQLQSIDPDRNWNFVEINVSGEELRSKRKRIIHHLIAPHSSVLDDSIGCALYFCGKGEGICRGESYTSPARVLFSGLGADEQLAGYSRHRGKFEERGWEGLLKESQLEMSRIHLRNCGRDDRVLSHHGRTPRFPYLDEDVVNCINSFPIWKKANLYMQRGVGEKLLLRVVAAQNGLTAAASLPKRAIQFGSRIAKLENSKEKGGDACSRLEAERKNDLRPV